MATSEELLEDILRIKVIELRLALGNQNETILEMSKAGFTPTKIASLIGTTAGTVNTALQRAKRTSRSSNKVKKDDGDGKK